MTTEANPVASLPPEMAICACKLIISLYFLVKMPCLLLWLIPFVLRISRRSRVSWSMGLLSRIIIRVNRSFLSILLFWLMEWLSLSIRGKRFLLWSEKMMLLSFKLVLFFRVKVFVCN